MITTAIADECELTRLGLRVVLARERDIVWVGSAAGGLEALEIVDEVKVNVLVLSVALLDMSGFAVLRKMISQQVATRVLMMSNRATETEALQAFRAGAVGYIATRESGGAFAVAIRRVAAGERYGMPLRAADVDPLLALTERERAIVKLIAEGNANAAIADLLAISVRTVESHRASAMRKIGARTQSEIVLFAIRRGLLPLD